MRIVSLLPSGSELVAALGLLDQLVGVSHECDYPAAVGSRPRLTSSILDHGLSPAEIDAEVARANLAKRPLYTVDGARLSALAPDLIVTQGVCSVCAVTEDTIGSSLSLLPVELATTAPVLSLSGGSWDGIRHDIAQLADATGAGPAADVLLAELDARWARLAAMPPPTERARVLMLEWPDPPWFGGHWVPEQVHVAGGSDPFGQPGLPSGRVDFDAIREADPDLICGIACGFDTDANEAHLRALLEQPEWSTLRAVRRRQVWAFDANGLFSRPGPRVVDGAELLADVLRGHAVDPSRARRV